jgi:diamine N-acetyltransferase
MPDQTPERTKLVLREITAATVRAVVALDVAEEQRGYVASNAVSIAEAYFNPGAWFRAACLGEMPIGFVMLFDPAKVAAEDRREIGLDEIGLWRLMIDRNHQRQGHGKRVLDLVRAHVRALGRSRLVSSYVPGPHGPEAFYLNYGFTRTGGLRNKGREVEISIAS